MYGHIHIILKDLILSVANAAAWQSILKEAGLGDARDEAQALDTVVQSDELTFALVGATCKVLGLTLDDALGAFGRHFVQFALRSGNGPFLKSQGSTFPAFLANVNNLHSHLERDHPNARFPFIEAKYDPDSDSVDLLYLSVRSGLQPLLIGVVEEVGIRLYGLDVSFEERPVPDDLDDARVAGHSAAWRVSWRNRPGGPEPLAPVAKEAEIPKMSFPTLHSTFVELMKMASCNVSCCAASAEGQQLSAQPRTVEGIHVGHGVMRATTACKVAAAWSDPSLAACREFWEKPTVSWELFALSEDVMSFDVFVSHTWSPPENWKLVMGEDIRYADLKCTALAVTAKDVVLTTYRQLQSWKDVTFWVDKACLSPHDVKEVSLALVEKIISRADRICVLFTWSYLERLWCVFEWACILTDKDPSKIWLQNEVFVTEQSFPLYIECIKYFSLKRTRCFVESDRIILVEKIDSCYVSTKGFERLVKATSIALMARSMAYRAGRSSRLHERFFRPWVELAQELGFDDLAEALDQCKTREMRAMSTNEECARAGSPAESRNAAPAIRHGLLGREGRLTSIEASKHHDHIHAWFDEFMNPVLAELRKEVVKR